MASIQRPRARGLRFLWPTIGTTIPSSLSTAIRTRTGKSLPCSPSSRDIQPIPTPAFISQPISVTTTGKNHMLLVAPLWRRSPKRFMSCSDQTNRTVQHISPIQVLYSYRSRAISRCSGDVSHHHDWRNMFFLAIKQWLVFPKKMKCFFHRGGFDQVIERWWMLQQSTEAAGIQPPLRRQCQRCADSVLQFFRLEMKQEDALVVLRRHCARVD